MLGPVVERHAVHVIHETFYRRIFRQDEGMGGQFDMVVCEDFRHVLVTENRLSIHERAGLDQDIIDEQGMIRGQQHIPRRLWDEAKPKLDPRRLTFLDETWAKTNMIRLRGRALRGQRLVGYAPLTIRV